MANHLAAPSPLTSQAGTQTKYNLTMDSFFSFLVTYTVLLQISALIIENAFTSIPNIVRQWRMGWFLSLLTTQKWWSASKVAQMPPSLPILMLSGLRDTVVPPSEMAELWKVAKMRPKNTTVKGWLWSTLGWKGDEENLIQPEHDIFKTFPFGGHSALSTSSFLINNGFFDSSR